MRRPARNSIAERCNARFLPDRGRREAVAGTHSLGSMHSSEKFVEVKLPRFAAFLAFLQRGAKLLELFFFKQSQSRSYDIAGRWIAAVLDFHLQELVEVVVEGNGRVLGHRHLRHRYITSTPVFCERRSACLGSRSVDKH